MKEFINKIVRTLLIIAVLTPLVLVFVFILYKGVEREEKLKEVEIERKLELVDWSDLRFDFTNECEKSLNEIDGLQSFLSTKKVFTDEEMRDIDFIGIENHTLSVEYLCGLLAESDALTKSFSRELSSVERRYDPSDYDAVDTEERMWRLLK